MIISQKKGSLISTENVLDKLEEVIFSLDHNPERGYIPQELERHGIKEYREIFFKPYRVIYEIDDKKVLVYIYVDGRRDMKALLERRFFR